MTQRFGSYLSASSGRQCLPLSDQFRLVLAHSKQAAWECSACLAWRLRLRWQQPFCYGGLRFGYPWYRVFGLLGSSFDVFESCNSRLVPHAIARTFSMRRCSFWRRPLKLNGCFLLLRGSAL